MFVFFLIIEAIDIYSWPFKRLLKQLSVQRPYCGTENCPWGTAYCPNNCTCRCTSCRCNTALDKNSVYEGNL
jgi:hypothetical protein